VFPPTFSETEVIFFSFLNLLQDSEISIFAARSYNKTYYLKPIHMAFMYPESAEFALEIIRLLVNYGANPYEVVFSHEGREQQSLQPLQLARKFKRLDIEELLSELL